MINVLVVDRPSLLREFLIRTLGADPLVQVVGTARDADEAVVATMRLRPNVIIMDIQLANGGAVEATRRIMEIQPTPILVVSDGASCIIPTTSFDAMEAGALAVLPCLVDRAHPDCAAAATEFLQTVKGMSEVKLVRRWPRMRGNKPSVPPSSNMQEKVEVIAIGASTGGPLVLQSILSALPANLSAPILIVQHMSAGFIQGFADWLALSMRLPIHLAAHGEVILPGHVYLAPDNRHMKVARGGRILLTGDEPEKGLRPAVSQLFRSVADIYGGHAVAGLLTGMGGDGAAELKLLKDKGALTFAQDKESSVVHGMPGEAIRLGATMLVLSPDKIVSLLAGFTNDK